MNNDLNYRSVLEMTDEEIDAYRKILGVTVIAAATRKTNVIRTIIKGKGTKKREYIVFNCDRCGHIDIQRKWPFLLTRFHRCRECKKKGPKYFVKKEKCVDKTIK